MVGGDICIFQRNADGGVIEEVIGIYAGTSISGLAASSNSRSESVFIFFFAISVLHAIHRQFGKQVVIITGASGECLLVFNRGKIKFRFAQGYHLKRILYDPGIVVKGGLELMNGPEPLTRIGCLIAVELG